MTEETGAGAPGDVAEAATAAPRGAVLVFVRAPVRGRVKTRLAADVGAEDALRIYRRLGRHAVACAAGLGGAIAVRVLYTPATAGDAVRRWLGAAPQYRPQSVGDLGERMASATSIAFRDGFRRVVVVGSDLPGLSTALLRRAFEALERKPVVVGPALDGGYYLIGLREPRPELFRGIPWSTDQVLEHTLQRLAAARISPALLPPLRDVDRAADLPPGW